MKYSLTILFGVCAFASLTSCDSSNPDLGTTQNDPTATAESLTAPVIGDLIRFTSTTSVRPVIPALVFEGPVTSILNTSYVYQKDGPNVFNIRVNSQQGNNLFAAVDATIGEPTQLASRLRALLNRPVANFTVAEIQEIVDLLNPAGANLIIDPNDNTKINATSTRLYRLRITSDNAAKRLGSIGGVYIIEETNFAVDFRPPTQAELNRYRLLSSDTKIPFVTTTQNVKQITERGTFIMELENVNNAPR